MVRGPNGVVVLVALAGGVSGARGDFLLVPDSTADRIVLLDAFDGSVVNANFIDVAAAATAAGVSALPIEALEVNGEIWVSDQTADRIWRFNASGSLLGSVGVGSLDNIRGMELVGNTLYVAQGSATTAAAAGVVTIDVTTQSLTGSFAGLGPDDISYWDVQSYNGELLVSNSDADGIERYATDGTFLGFFAQSDGETSFDFLQQMTVRGSNGNLLGGGFSLPSGVFEFMSDGTPLGIVGGDGFGPRAAWELGNGELIWTNGTWIRSDTTILLEGGSFRYFSPTSIPGPGALLSGVVAGVMCVRRRR